MSVRGTPRRIPLRSACPFRPFRIPPDRIWRCTANTYTKVTRSGRDCADIAQQLHAVEKAISAAKKLLIHDHLDHCLEEIAKSPRDFGTAIAEFKDITKYL
jgi:DNA-binding FrmR family transcriptional regulator